MDPAALVEELGSSDMRKRLDAYRKLQRLRPTNLPQLLESCMDDLPHHGRQLASNLLRSVPGDARRRLDERLADSADPYLKAMGAAGLIRLHDRTGDRSGRRGALEAMAAAVRTCDAGNELPAVLQELGAVRDAVVLDALVARLKPDVSGHLLGQLLMRLWDSPHGGATEAAVRKLAEAQDRRVRAVALAFLAREHDDAVEGLVELLEQHEDLLASVASQLEGSRRLNERLVEALLGLFESLRSPHDLTRLVRLLSGQPSSRIAGALGPLIDHEDDKLRDAALKAMAALPGGLSDKDAQKLLQSSSPLAHVVAADSLRRRDDRSGLDVVLRAANTAGAHRAEAARVLGEFRSREAIPVLLGLLDDADAGVRSRAWIGLQQTLRSLYPFRRFDFATAGYDPAASDRSAGISVLRRYWQQLQH